MKRIVVGAVLGAALLAPGTANASTESKPKPLTGTTVFGTFDKGYVFSRYQPGRSPEVIARTLLNPQFSVSPDGRRVAWVGEGGKLKINDGRRITIVATGLRSATPCLTPAWSPDSRRLAYVRSGETVTVVDADGTDGRRAGSTKGVCHLAWSANGRYLAGYAGTTEGVYKLDLKTGKAAKVKGIRLANHVQSLSPGGRKVIVRLLSATAPGGDGSWPAWFTPAVVDTVTGKRSPIKVKGKLIGALYLPDGRMVVRVAGRLRNTLVVLDTSGRQLQSLAEPAKARTHSLLHVD